MAESNEGSPKGSPKASNRPSPLNFTATFDEPEPIPPDAEKLDKAFNATKRNLARHWTMRGKPNMIPGDAVPSWVRSIPGPKYNIDTDQFKPRAPSWGFSKTGRSDPKDSGPMTPQRQRKLDNEKMRAESIAEGLAQKQTGMLKSASAPSSPCSPTVEQIDKGWEVSTPKPPVWSMSIKPAMIIGGNVPSWTNSIPGPKYLYDTNQFKARQPVYTLGGKLEFVSGGAIPSWVKSIPGPKYTYDTDKFKNRRPTYTIGEKLPTEGEIMSKRSPGPIYHGPVTDASKQSLVDSTKKRTCAPSFGIGSRFEGRAAAMVRTGATGRFEHGKHAFE